MYGAGVGRDDGGAVARYDNQVPLMKDNKLMIPANVSKHIYERRVVNDKRTSESIVRVAERAFHNNQATVVQGNYPHIQGMQHLRGKFADVGYISVNPKTGKNVVKTVMNKDRKKLK